MLLVIAESHKIRLNFLQSVTKRQAIYYEKLSKVFRSDAVNIIKLTIKRLWQLTTFTQLRATWHNDSLDTVVLPSAGASRYLKLWRHQSGIFWIHNRITQRWVAFVQPFLQLWSNTYYIFWVSVCSLRFPSCVARAPYFRLWFVGVYKIFLHCIMKGTIFEKKSYWT
jgi:hypothetical protein